MPSASGKIRGIVVPDIPWHPEEKADLVEKITRADESISSLARQRLDRLAETTISSKDEQLRLF